MSSHRYSPSCTVSRLNLMAWMVPRSHSNALSFPANSSPLTCRPLSPPSFSLPSSPTTLSSSSIGTSGLLLMRISGRFHSSMKFARHFGSTWLGRSSNFSVCWSRHYRRAVSRPSTAGGKAEGAKGAPRSNSLSRGRNALCSPSRRGKRNEPLVVPSTFHLRPLVPGGAPRARLPPTGGSGGPGRGASGWCGACVAHWPRPPPHRGRPTRPHAAPLPTRRHGTRSPPPRHGGGRGGAGRGGRGGAGRTGARRVGLGLLLVPGREQLPEEGAGPGPHRRPPPTPPPPGLLSLFSAGGSLLPAASQARGWWQI